MPDTPFNLVREEWIPVRRADGSRACIAPWQITTALADNPILAVDWPRPDFNGVTLEFLIGLIATASPPADLDQWLDRWESPPPPEDLRTAFERIAFAFNLDGDGPRFMQELGGFEDPSEREIAALLIEQPGEQSVERHADHFVKHGTIGTLSRAAATIALYAVQTYSPAGGRGFLTSMRGGGPLTTLAAADPRAGIAPLWGLLWPNVPYAAGPEWSAGAAKVFPWLAATRSSRDHPVTTPEHGHALQAFWGMPRRVQLVFEPAAGRPCDLGGPPDETAVVGWLTKQYGIKYEGWVHPLSPYVQPRSNEPRSAVKGNPGGVTYRHWLGLVQEDAENGRLPARCVQVLRDERADDADIAGIRLVAFGYDMENMKARCWYQAEMPMPNVAPAHREAFDGRAAQLVRAADIAAGRTRSAVKQALFASPKDAKGEFSLLADRFWRDTEAQFFDLLNDLAKGESDDASLREGWLKDLRRTALATFDDAVPGEGIEAGAWRRLVEARKWLARNLDGKDIRAALGLAPTAIEPMKRAGRKAEGKPQ